MLGDGAPREAAPRISAGCAKHLTALQMTFTCCKTTSSAESGAVVFLVAALLLQWDSANTRVTEGSCRCKDLTLDGRDET